MKMTKRGWLLAALAAAHLLGMEPLAVGQLANEPLAQATSGKGEAMLGSMNNGAISVAATGFEENKGQVKTTAGQPAPFVRYRFTKGSTSIFLLESGIAYQFERVHQPEGYAELLAETHRNPEKQQELDALNAQVRRETYRMDMYLEGANPHARTSAEGRSDDYTNYYNHDALDVHHYSRVTYHDVYPGIDWVTYTTEKGMKYDFVVHPGADPDRIRLRFENQEELSLASNGSLAQGNRLGRFTEESPVSYQGGQQIETEFVLRGNLVQFAIGDYSRNKTLVIDPVRSWGTYYGTVFIEYGRSSSMDEMGYFYLAGWTDSSSGIASGGYQNTIGGLQDAFLVKFNSAGNRIWATYYGGPNPDYGYGCAVDGSGNVYLAGSTDSPSGISSGGHQTVYGGSGDGFLVKFNPSGWRIWSTYYGGSGSDGGFSCAVDGNGNVLLTGVTGSSVGIASLGYQANQGGGIDAMLVKFNGNGVRQWGTYYGGTGSDFGQSCTSDALGNVYMTGRTDSNTSISYDGHQNSIGGLQDAFIVKFDMNGARTWATYYGGSGNESGSSCVTDLSGNIYLCGSTASFDSIATGGYQNIYGGGGNDAFLVKFSSLGVRIWGTFYGGPGSDGAVSVAHDGVGGVVIAGSTASLSGITTGGYQSTYGGGGSDAFLAKFSVNGSLNWSTYYGGNSGDTGSSCLAKNGTIYLSGVTGSGTNIASGGYQNTPGAGQDAFAAKFQDAVYLNVKALLEGPAIPGLASMQDQLRQNGVLPLIEPYTALGYSFITGGGEGLAAPVLATSGANAIVDWVLLELRGADFPTVRVAARAALIQKDGDVVDMDGVSPVSIQAPVGNYYVALRHRNHLGVMTAAPLGLSFIPASIDFTSAATGTYGTNARKDVFGSQLLWSGDVSFNGELKYTGSGNDRDPILVAIGSTLPNNTVNGYRREDTNMDGVVRYTGTANDRDPILVNVGSTTPNAVRVQQLP